MKLSTRLFIAGCIAAGASTYALVAYGQTAGSGSGTGSVNSAPSTAPGGSMGGNTTAPGSIGQGTTNDTITIPDSGSGMRMPSSTTTPAPRATPEPDTRGTDVSR